MTAAERKAERLAKALIKAIENIEADLEVSPDIFAVELHLAAKNKHEGVRQAVDVLSEYWNGE